MIPELARLHHLRGNIFSPSARSKDAGRSMSAAWLRAAVRIGRGGGACARRARGRGLRSGADAHGVRKFQPLRGAEPGAGLGRIEVANRSMIGSAGSISMRPGRRGGRRRGRAGGGAGRAASRRNAGRNNGRCRMLRARRIRGHEVYLERTMRFARQLKARRFEAQLWKCKLESSSTRVAGSRRRRSCAKRCRSAATSARNTPGPQ